MRQGDRHRLLQEHESVGYETVKFLAGLSEDTRDGLLRALFRERLFDNYSFADITWVVRNSTAAAAGAETKHRLSNNGTPPGATLMTPHSIPDVPIVGDASPLYTASATPAAAAPTPVVLSTSPQDPLSPYHCESIPNWKRWTGEKALRPVRDFQKDCKTTRTQPKTAAAMLCMTALLPERHSKTYEGQPTTLSIGARQLQVFRTLSNLLHDPTLDHQWQAGLARGNLTKADILKALNEYPLDTVNSTRGESHMKEVDMVIRHLLHIVTSPQGDPPFPPRLDSLRDEAPLNRNAEAVAPPRTSSLLDRPSSSNNREMVVQPSRPPTKLSPRSGDKRSIRNSRIMTAQAQAPGTSGSQSAPNYAPTARPTMPIPSEGSKDPLAPPTLMTPSLHQHLRPQGRPPGSPFSQPRPSRHPAFAMQAAQPAHPANFAFPSLSNSTSSGSGQVHSESWNVENDDVFRYNGQTTSNQQQLPGYSGDQNEYFDPSNQNSYGDLPSNVYQQFPGDPHFPYDDPFTPTHTGHSPYHQNRPA